MLVQLRGGKLWAVERVCHPAHSSPTLGRELTHKCGMVAGGGMAGGGRVRGRRGVEGDSHRFHSVIRVPSRSLLYELELGLK